MTIDKILKFHISISSASPAKQLVKNRLVQFCLVLIISLGGYVALTAQSPVVIQNEYKTLTHVDGIGNSGINNHRIFFIGSKPFNRKGQHEHTPAPFIEKIEDEWLDFKKQLSQRYGFTEMVVAELIGTYSEKSVCLWSLYTIPHTNSKSLYLLQQVFRI